MNSEELREQWSRVYETVIASDDVDTSQATAFLSRLQPQAMSDSFIMLTADNSWLKSWIEGHYVDHIRQALRDIHGKEYVVAIEVDENQAVPEPRRPRLRQPMFRRPSQHPSRRPRKPRSPPQNRPRPKSRRANRAQTSTAR